MLKRNNLYVTNFPSELTEDALRNLFKQFGEIESIKLESAEVTPYAFVCFKSAESCSQAKVEMNGMTIMGKNLVIAPYELKEVRELLKEEEQDQKDWDNYVAQKQRSSQGMDFFNQEGIGNLIQSILMMSVN